MSISTSRMVPPGRSASSSAPEHRLAVGQVEQEQPLDDGVELLARGEGPHVAGPGPGPAPRRRRRAGAQPPRAGARTAWSAAPSSEGGAVEQPGDEERHVARGGCRGPGRASRRRSRPRAAAPPSAPRSRPPARRAAARSPDRRSPARMPALHPSCPSSPTGGRAAQVDARDVRVRTSRRGPPSAARPLRPPRWPLPPSEPWRDRPCPASIAPGPMITGARATRSGGTRRRRSGGTRGRRRRRPGPGDGAGGDRRPARPAGRRRARRGRRRARRRRLARRRRAPARVCRARPPTAATGTSWPRRRHSAGAAASRRARP